jgi:gamma-glutamyl phosphate reductase
VIVDLAKRAKAASVELATLSTEAKNEALLKMARALIVGLTVPVSCICPSKL